MSELPLEEFRARRARAFTALNGGVAIVPSATVLLRNGDSDYPFRQNSDFLYLTGFNEPDAVLVLLGDHRSVLFMRPKDRALEVWTGHRLGLDDAPATLGIDIALDIATLEEKLPAFLVGCEHLSYDFGNDEARDRSIFASIHAARGLTRRKGVAPHTLHGLNTWIAELRRIKSPAEIELMRKAAAITHRGHIAAMQAVAPGMYEYDLQAILEYEYRRAGAQGIAYESIVATGANATVLHYVENRRRIADGDVVLIDSGAEYHGYAADVTRTFPANGRFTSEQRALYEIVLQAMNDAFTHVRPGVARTAYHDRAVATITQGLLDLGILHGSFDEAIESLAYQEYYMHGTGHWLGLDVHDAGRYRDRDDTPTRLEPGMALTVEPGIYVRNDAPCDPRFHGIGIRIEDDLLVTPDGYENLTASIPKSIDDLNAIMREKVSA